MRVQARVAACAIVLSRAAVVAAAPENDPFDEREAKMMRAEHPAVAELLEKGEELANEGRAAEADAVFLQALKDDPQSALLWRRHCEARTVLGPRTMAVEACTRALERMRNGPTFRALVSAFVDGPVPPTTTQLFEALIVTGSASKESTGQPTAAAAACDIAEKLGDGVMLQQCTEELVRIAPHDPATKRALAMLARRCPPWRFWLGWTAIALAIAATVGDAVRRVVRWRPGRRPKVVAIALAWAVVVGFSSRSAFADEARAQSVAEDKSAAPKDGWLSKWPIDPDHPEAHIPIEQVRNADPLQFGYWLQDLVWRAEHASKRGDHAQAAKYYVALADAVPDRSAGFTRACDEYEALGEVDLAISACAQGLLRDGVLVKDYQHFIRLILAKPGRLGKKEVSAISTVLAHMKEDPAGRDFVDELECEVGARTSNVAQLRECTSGMAARGEEGSKLLSYQWNLAVEEGKFQQARALVEQARMAGTPADKIASMLKVTSSYERWHWIRLGLAMLAVALLGAGVGIGVRAFQRRQRGATGSATPPPPSAATAPG